MGVLPRNHRDIRDLSEIAIYGWEMPTITTRLQAGDAGETARLKW
jgi:hypothetical protein